MSHTPHELSEEFPEHRARLQELRESDPHFARLVEDYHDINRAVHRAETNVEPTDAGHEAELRRKRLALKDEIYRALTAAA